MRGIPAGPGDEVSAVYVDPPPPGVTTLPGHANARSTATRRDPRGRRPARRERPAAPEPARRGAPAQGRRRPLATCRWPSFPSKVLSTRPIDEALAEVAQRVVDAGDELPRTAGIDLLARRLPRLRRGGPLPGVGVGPTRHLEAIEAALLATDDSYLAVQGPPGTGKTYVASRVIARLVLERGWAVGRHLAGAQGDRERPARRRRRRGPARAGRQGDPRPRGRHLDHPGQGRRARRVRRRARARRPGLRRRRHRLGPHQHQAHRPRPARPRRRRRGGAVLPREDPRLLGGRRPAAAARATPSSCRRCRRAPTPTPSTRPRSAG